MTLVKLNQLEVELKIAEDLALDGIVSREWVLSATRRWIAARDEAMREGLIAPLSDVELELGF